MRQINVLDGKLMYTLHAVLDIENHHHYVQFSYRESTFGLSQVARRSPCEIPLIHSVDSLCRCAQLAEYMLDIRKSCLILQCKSQSCMDGR